MGSRHPRKQQLVFCQETTRHATGYWHTRVCVYDTPELTPIDAAIARCDEPGVYTDAGAAARNKRRFERLRDAGALQVVDLGYRARCDMTWQHYNTPYYRSELDEPAAVPQYCAAHVELAKRRDEVRRDYKLWQRLETLMRRRFEKLRASGAPSTGYAWLDRDCPELLLETLKHAKAAEMVMCEVPDPDFGSWREWCIMRPRAVSTETEFTLVAPQRVGAVS